MHTDIFVCIPVVIFIITLIDNDPLTNDINRQTASHHLDRELDAFLWRNIGVYFLPAAS